MRALGVLLLWSSFSFACGPLIDGLFGNLVGTYERASHPSAPTYVVLHGLSEDGAQMQGVADVLRREGYGVLRVDLLGHGRTVELSPHRVPWILWFSDQVAAVARAIASLGVPEVHLVGHSYGGGLALALAEQHAPTRIASLTLFAPYLMRMDAYFAARLCPVGGAAPWLAAFFAMADPWTDACPVAHAFFRESIAKNLRRTGTKDEGFEARLRGAHAALRGARSTDFLLSPPKIAPEVPLRISIGSRDRLIPVSMVHEFARAMRRRGHRRIAVEEVPFGTHHLPQESPQLVLAP